MPRLPQPKETTIHDWLHAAVTRLRQAGIDSARLDALILLCDELDRDKAWIFAYPNHILQIRSVKILNKKIVQRCSHLPLAYIRGHVEFYGRTFMVTPDVLVPRPESEAIITLLKQAAHTLAVAAQSNHTKSSSHILTIIDIGTGSGALAITAAKEVLNSTVLATDIDKKCIHIAQQNNKIHKTSIVFTQADLLHRASEPTRMITFQTPCIVLCNLPYVPSAMPLNHAATHEPQHALFSGPDGLDHYRRLFMQISTLAQKPDFIIIESLKKQHHSVTILAKSTGFNLYASDGLALCFRRTALHS